MALGTAIGTVISTAIGMLPKGAHLDVVGHLHALLVRHWDEQVRCVGLEPKRFRRLDRLTKPTLAAHVLERERSVIHCDVEANPFVMDALLKHRKAV